MPRKQNGVAQENALGYNQVITKSDNGSEKENEMGYFGNKRYSDAEVFEKSKFFQEGNYLVRLNKNLLKTGHKGRNFIIECEILGAESDHDEAPQPGQKAAHIWKADHEMAMSTYMQFMCALFGVESPKAVSDEKWDRLSDKVWEQQKYAGTDMVVRVFETTTKAGNTFTVHNWERVATDEDYERFDVEPE